LRGQAEPTLRSPILRSLAFLFSQSLGTNPPELLAATRPEETGRLKFSFMLSSMLKALTWRQASLTFLRS